MIMLADRLPDPASGQQTLGGIDMTVRRNAFGRQVDSFERDLDVAGIDGPPYRPCSSARRGWRRSGPASRFSPPTPARVGSSPFARVGRSPRRFIPSSPADWRIHEMFVDMVRDRA